VQLCVYVRRRHEGSDERICAAIVAALLCRVDTLHASVVPALTSVILCEDRSHAMTRRHESVMRQEDRLSIAAISLFINVATAEQPSMRSLLSELAATVTSAFVELAKPVHCRIHEALAVVAGPWAVLEPRAAPLLTDLCIDLLCRNGANDAVRRACAAALGDIAQASHICACTRTRKTTRKNFRAKHNSSSGLQTNPDVVNAALVNSLNAAVAYTDEQEVAAVLQGVVNTLAIATQDVGVVTTFVPFSRPRDYRLPAAGSSCMTTANQRVFLIRAATVRACAYICVCVCVCVCVRV
jgi:hypothetical protein